jgi:CO dehydrogenase maturation factor
MIVTLSGKGGVGKTSLTALLLDELARAGYAGPAMAVDGDPAMTLHMALGFPEPAATVAAVRDSVTLDAKTVRGLPAGTTPAAYVRGKLEETGVIAARRLRQMPLDLMAMGQGEGPGCYCDVNRALATALEHTRERYALVLIDNEAGVEHLSRLRVGRVDLFLVVTTPSPAAWATARRIQSTARQSGMILGETCTVVNRMLGSAPAFNNGLTVSVPHSSELAVLDSGGRPVVELPDGAAARLALRPIVERLLQCA